MIILCAPIIMGKLRIPHIVGMVLAGVAIGKYGLHILERDTSFELFGKVGLYYILFLAALEMDIEGLKKNKFRFVIFGFVTFLLPFFLTFFIARLYLFKPISYHLIADGLYHVFAHIDWLSHCK